MKILTLALAAAAAASTTGPTAAQFNAALEAACPDHQAATRNVTCARDGAASVQFRCRYELHGADGRWVQRDALLQQAEGEWVWIDGPTLCDGEGEPELN